MAERDAWRSRPGFLQPGHAERASIQILLGRFLVDRIAPNPLPERSLFPGDGAFRWGAAPPLEKVLHARADLESLALRPRLLRSAVAIVEPWDHVGRNAADEPLRASTNVAYLLQKIADCDSVLLPVWSSGVFDLEVLVPLLASSLAVVFEGGEPSVHDEASFSSPRCSRADLFALVEQLLLARAQSSAPAVFICLGHQLAAACLVELLRRSVAEVIATREIPRDRHGDAQSALEDVCARIAGVGEKLEVRKQGLVVAPDWSAPCFAVARNESGEQGTRVLVPYRPPHPRTSQLPKELILAQQVVADRYEGVIDTLVGSEKQVGIEMFHGDEVNEEAMLFANWAFGALHDAMIPHRAVLAGSPLAWLLQLPSAVEILCSTTTEQGLLTECAALGIYYRDLETKRMRRSFSCQFHPELLAGQGEVGRGSAPPPSYSELKRDDGARIFARMLYEGMQE